MARNKRESGEFSASSMADIAFLLLIFFLVTTTMDVDTGLMRLLPPPVPEDQETPPIKQRNVFIVLVNRNDQMMVEGKLTDVSELREKTKEFIINPLDDPDLSEKKEQEIELLGPTMVSKGVVSLQNDRGTSYEKYILVQNEIMAAYNELRNEMSIRSFGKPYDDLTSEKAKAIRTALPLSISEAEPKNIGGN